MSALLILGAIVAWVLGLVAPGELDSSALEWLLIGLILFAASFLVGPIRELRAGD